MQKLSFVFHSSIVEAYTKLGVHQCTLYTPNGLAKTPRQRSQGNPARWE